MDPHFVASINELKKYKSSVRNNEGKYPMWNENFIFPVDESDEDLTIELFHGKETLGFAEIKLKSLPQNKEVYEELSIKYKFQSNGKLKVRYVLETPQFNSNVDVRQQQTFNQNLSHNSGGGIKIGGNNSGNHGSNIYPPINDNLNNNINTNTNNNYNLNNNNQFNNNSNQFHNNNPNSFGQNSNTNYNQLYTNNNNISWNNSQNLNNNSTGQGQNQWGGLNPIPNNNVNDLHKTYTNNQGFNQPLNNNSQGYNQPPNNFHNQGFNQPPYNYNNQGFNQPLNNNSQGFNQPLNNNSQGFNQPLNNNSQGFNQQPNNFNNQGFNQPLNNNSQGFNQPPNNFNNQGFNQPLNNNSNHFNNNSQNQNQWSTGTNNQPFNNNWSTGNNNSSNQFNTQTSGISPEFANKHKCVYTQNNYNFVEDSFFKISSDNQLVPKHNVNSETLNTPWWRSLTYPKNPVFFSHGGTQMYCFDIEKKKWVKLNNNTNQFFPKYHRITELPDSSFLMSGGEVNNGTVTNSFHYFNQNFIPKENMNFARKAHGHIYCKGFVYVFGGFDNNGTIASSERYDMNHGGWTNLSNMIVPKAYVSCCRFSEEYIFLIGGFSSQDNDGIMEQESIDRYDIKNNTFCTFKVKLPIASYGFACCMISNDEVLICGGFNNRTGKSSKVFVADLGKAFIKNLPDLPTPGWTVQPVYYNEGSFHMLLKGEEVPDEGLPDVVIYNTMIGL